MSSANTVAFLSTSGTSPCTMRRARPSAIAVLPTPASPTNSGLFFCRRHSTWMVRLISAERPINGSILPLQEISGMTLALGENRDQHVGAGHLLAARRLHVDDGALDDALEACGRLGILVAVAHQILELAFEIRSEAPSQLVEVDVARAHDRGGVLVVD